MPHSLADTKMTWAGSFRELRKAKFRVEDVLKHVKSTSFDSSVRWHVLGVKMVWSTDLASMLYDLNYWSLTVVVLTGYLSVAALFVILLYPAMACNPEALALAAASGHSVLCSTFYLSLGALAQTAVSLTELVPTTTYTIAIVTIEHFAGVLMSAVLLGVLINKASIPSVKVVFSDNLLLTSRDGVPMVILRIGNTRGNFLLNPEIRIGYCKVQHTEEGESIVKLIPMEFDEPAAVSPCLNIACRIQESSPLWGKTYEDLKAEGACFYIGLAATDNSHYQEVFARKYYLLGDIRFNCRFADVLTKMDGSRAVDFHRFNDLIENEKMPISYGLKYDEIVALNGPDVRRNRATSYSASNYSLRHSSGSSVVGAESALSMATTYREDEELDAEDFDLEHHQSKNMNAGSQDLGSLHRHVSDKISLPMMRFASDIEDELAVNSVFQHAAHVQSEALAGRDAHDVTSSDRGDTPFDNQPPVEQSISVALGTKADSTSDSLPRPPTPDPPMSRPITSEPPQESVPVHPQTATGQALPRKLSLPAPAATQGTPWLQCPRGESVSEPVTVSMQPVDMRSAADINTERIVSKRAVRTLAMRWKRRVQHAPVPEDSELAPVESAPVPTPAERERFLHNTVFAPDVSIKDSRLLYKKSENQMQSKKK